jgi:LasA protease
MKIKLPQQVMSRSLLLKHSRSITIWFSFCALFIITALACNLPQRQPDVLTFPTYQSLVTVTDLSFPTGEATLLPASPEEAGFPPATLEAGESVYPFWDLQTATTGPSLPGSWLTPNPGSTLPNFTYITQPGDTLTALAARFGIAPYQISPQQPATGLLQAGQQLSISNLLGDPPYPSALLPDSAIIYSPSSADFHIDTYIAEAGGYLSTYREKVDVDEWLTGSEIVRRVALESSIDPKLLLAFLEFRSGWVRGQPANPSQLEYPIGFYLPDYHGLYLELALVAKELNIGYYGWRQGTLTDLIFPGYTHVRISPGLNAGSVALQTLTSMFYRQQSDWLEALYGQRGFLAVYAEMFGDPWSAAVRVEPLFPPDLQQPLLELPFAPGEYWSLTAGPHISWKTGTPRGALDFAPITGEPPCAVSRAWVTASASGIVVRAERGVVALDLDGDGLEQTGWVLIYMHVAEQERAPLGSWLETNSPLGHPSCEGGQATGTNIHLARKYNGEWLEADGPLPMVLSGWVAHAGELGYDGTLEKDGQTISAHPDGSSGSTIVR